jgi:predicted site-specific integrase-resolvase
MPRNWWMRFELRQQRERVARGETEIERAAPSREKEIVREIVKIRCRYCGKLYGERLDRCPHCGASS